MLCRQNHQKLRTGFVKTRVRLGAFANIPMKLLYIINQTEPSTGAINALDVLVTESYANTRRLLQFRVCEIHGIPQKMIKRQMKLVSITRVVVYGGNVRLGMNGTLL